MSFGPEIIPSSDIVRRPFKCWMCGGQTVKLYQSYARYCGTCEVTEARRKTPYIPWVRIETVTPAGDLYIDHSVTHFPSPG